MQEKMKVLICGASGMVGKGVLDLCLESKDVSEVISLSRRDPALPQEGKLKNVQISDFKTYDGRSDLFQNIDVVFFCIGAYTGKV